MGFKKGHDPNRSTGGRPTRDSSGYSLPEKCRALTPETLAVQLEIMRNPNEAAADRLRAAKAIQDRAWGQSKVTIDSTSTVQHQHLVSSIDVTLLSPAVRRQLLAARIADEESPIEGKLIDPEADDDSAE